jgi:SAM-dependent methyltransferase
MLHGVLARARTSLRLRALDLADTVRGRSEPLVPPRRLHFVGPGDFVAVGDEFLGHFVELGDLKPTDRVLDIGCGIGRMARPLTRYLDAAGSYDGFDVSLEGIEWCRRHYARFDGFRFEHADLVNATYNPGGAERAREYRFPYPDASFDFAFAISVFTHLVQPDAANYLAEASRLLKPGGRLFTTWLLIDDDARARIAAGDAAFDLVRHDAETAVMNSGTPEEAIAFEYGWVRGRLDEQRLTLRGLWRGMWSGRESGRSFQDIVIAAKPARPS